MGIFKKTISDLSIQHVASAEENSIVNDEEFGRGLDTLRSFSQETVLHAAGCYSSNHACCLETEKLSIFDLFKFRELFDKASLSFSQAKKIIFAGCIDMLHAAPTLKDTMFYINSAFPESTKEIFLGEVTFLNEEHCELLAHLPCIANGLYRDPANMQLELPPRFGLKKNSNRIKCWRPWQQIILAADYI